MSYFHGKKCGFLHTYTRSGTMFKKLRPLHDKYLTSFTVLMKHTSEKGRKWYECRTERMEASESGCDKKGDTVIPRLTSDSANEFFG